MGSQPVCVNSERTYTNYTDANKGLPVAMGEGARGRMAVERCMQQEQKENDLWGFLRRQGLAEGQSTASHPAQLTMQRRG